MSSETGDSEHLFDFFQILVLQNPFPYTADFKLQRI